MIYEWRRSAESHRSSHELVRLWGPSTNRQWEKIARARLIFFRIHALKCVRFCSKISQRGAKPSISSPKLFQARTLSTVYNSSQCGPNWRCADGTHVPLVSTTAAKKEKQWPRNHRNLPRRAPRKRKSQLRRRSKRQGLRRASLVLQLRCRRERGAGVLELGAQYCAPISFVPSAGAWDSRFPSFSVVLHHRPIRP